MESKDLFYELGLDDAIGEDVVGSTTDKAKDTLIDLRTDNKSEYKCLYCDADCPNYDMDRNCCKGLIAEDELLDDDAVAILRKAAANYDIDRNCYRDSIIDDDAVAILRKVAADEHPVKSLWDAFGFEKTLAELLSELADMIERDYIRRDEWLEGKQQIAEQIARERRTLNKIEAQRDEARAFADRLRDSAEKQEDVTIFGVDYMPYPQDADGVPIHVGDELVLLHNSNHVKVRSMELLETEEMRWRMWPEGGGGGWGDYTECRHYEQPTVEDVLREFGDRYCDVILDSDAEKELFAEYAAKLRLAGDVDSERKSDSEVSHLISEYSAKLQTANTD